MSLPTFEVPPIGPRQGKVWGVTQLVMARNDVECHAIHAKAGGYSSRHRHVAKWNRFYCVSGRLAVRQYHGERCDEIILAAGQITDVPPGVQHEFEALEDSVAFEFYWVVLDAGDIDRGGTEGGLRQTEKSPPEEAKSVYDKYPVVEKHCWEAVPASECLGYRVRWSHGDPDGRYLWVRHYLTDGDNGSPSLQWCRHAAERDAEQLNRDGRQPWEFPAWRSSTRDIEPKTTAAAAPAT